MRSYTIKLSILSYLLFLCSGCGHQPQKATLSPPLPMGGTVDKALASSQFALGEWPSREWWEVFEDPQLSGLIEKAIKESPSIKKVEAKLIFAEQNAKKVRASLFPTLSGDYNENWQYFSKNGFVRDFYPITGGVQVPAKVNQIDLSLNFFYEFDFWGRNRKMYKAALGEAKAQLAERIQAELTLSTLVAFSYFQLQSHRAELALYKTILENWKTSYDLILQKEVAGVSNRISVLDVAKEIYAAEEKVSESQKNIEIDLYVLKALAAQGPDSQLEVHEAPLYFTRSIALPKHLGADLLARRADLMAMIWRAEAASREIGVAKTDFYPNINLAALVGVESLQFPTLFQWSSRTGALQPAIHLPIFTGGKLSANLSSKIAKYNEAVQTYNEGLLEASKEVATELSTLYSLHDQVGMQNKLVGSRVEKESLSLERFEKGIDDYLEFLLSRTERARAEIHKVELQSMHLLSVVRLIKSLGGGYHADEIPSLMRKE